MIIPVRDFAPPLYIYPAETRRTPPDEELAASSQRAFRRDSTFKPRYLHLYSDTRGYRGTSMESNPVAIPPSQEILTLGEVLIHAQKGKQCLIAVGLSTTRNIKRRLAWKRSRGIDTTVEKRYRGVESL